MPIAGNRDQHIARLEHGHDHDLLMRIRLCPAGHAEKRKFLLGVAGDYAGCAEADARRERREGERERAAGCLRPPVLVTSGHSSQLSAGA